MQIDINKLTNMLKQAENTDNPTGIEVCDYLKNDVVKPLLSGELLYVSDIDFSSFSMDELENLRLFLAHSNDIVSRLNHLCGIFSAIKPRAVSAPVFC